MARKMTAKIGEAFGHWEVVALPGVAGTVTARCVCGKTCNVIYRSLKSGHSKSCGCRKAPRPGQLADYARQNEIGKTFLRRAHATKSSAAQRGLVFELSTEELFRLVCGECHYCGLQGPNGVDRVDNSLGYTPTNCVSACEQCNIAKNNYMYDLFVDWVERVHAKVCRGAA